MDTIENSYLASYLAQNIKLSKTLVIKLDEAPVLMNEGIVAQYGSEAVDQNAPATWKYYLNVSGQYHPTDAMMRVVSIDTLETIDFTLANLAVHTATAKAFAYGTRHYNSLVAQYPKQELLINGILTPVALDTAIAAQSGDILAYPDGLIEANEDTLLDDLSAYVKRMLARWNNNQFAMSDDLYLSTMFTMLNAFILPKLLNLRLARCHTREAHSFHVRMYLASHQGLDRFLPYLTLKQALWLYRNIAYIERHVGRKHQFVTLIAKLLTDRGVPLGEYSIRHQDEFDVKLMPVVKARLKWLNTPSNASTMELQPIADAFDREEDLTLDNAVMLKAHEDDYTEAFQAATSSVIQTKLLTSEMIDYSNSVPEPFEVVALRQWCYLAHRDMYPVSVSFKDPKTAEVRTLFAKDAFLYVYYLELRSSGLTVDVFPDYLNMQQRRTPTPSVDDLLSVTDTQKHWLRAIAQAIVDRQPAIRTCYSVSAFYAQARTLTDEAYWHWFLVSSMGDYYERAMVENMLRRLYEDERVDLKPSISPVSDWLAKNNLPEYDLTPTEAQELIRVIFEAGSGYVVDDTKVLKNIQKAMLDIMTQLSSYSIQFVRSINTDDIVAINWPAIRLGIPYASQKDHRTLESGVVVVDNTGYGAERCHYDALPDARATMRGAPVDALTPVPIDTGIVVDTKAVLMAVVDDLHPMLTIDITYAGQDNALEDGMLLPGYTTFNKLPESARKTLKFH